jgi:tetratricopeptide (TPR) repeat protein
LARAGGYDRLFPEIELWRGAALQTLGRVEEAVEVWDRTIRLAEATGDLDTLHQVLSNRGNCYLDEGEFDRGVEYLVRALAAAERVGSPVHVGFVLATLSGLLFYLGEWDMAEVHLQRALDTVRPLGSTWHFAVICVYLGQLYLAEGKRGEGSRYLKECIAIAERSDDIMTIRFAQQWLAEQDLFDGHPEAARNRLEPLLDRPGQEEQFVTQFLPMLAWAYVELGNLTLAQETLAQGIRRAEVQHLRLFLPDYYRVRAMLLIQQRRWEEAEHSLQEALSLTRAMRYPLAEGRVLQTWSQFHTGEGEAELARERLEEALTIFRRLGAMGDVERTEQALAQLEDS